MKKLYFLLLLCCMGVASFAQTAIIYASGAAGSFKCGSSTATTRTDGNTSFSCTGTTVRGYCVFDLSSIPASATVTSVIVGVYVSNYTGFGTPSGWATYGYPGDLSTITTPATLFAQIVNAPSTLLATSTYGTTTGSKLIGSNAAMVAFAQANLGSKVSIGLTGGNTRIYNFGGETQPQATSFLHAPYIQVDYNCTGVSGVAATATPTTLCEGTSLTLSGSGTGVATYTWAGPGGYAATGQNQTFTVGAANAGVYTLTAANSGGCGVKATTSTVVVNPYPSTTITPSGPTAFCSGGSVVLSAPATAGYTYQWFDGSGALPGETNMTYTANSTSSLSVRVTDANGCFQTSPATQVVSLTSVTLNPAGSAPLCAGAAIVLNAVTGGTSSSISYQWRNALTDIPAATNSSYSTTSSGSFDVVVSTPTCSLTSPATVITIYPLPTPTVTQAGSVLATGISYINYQWFLNTVAIPGATSSTVVPTVNGSYRVRVTDANGCVNYSNSFWFGSLGVGQVSAADISIYPNPANDVLHIAAPVKLNAQVSSMDGRKLIETTNSDEISVGSLPGTLYTNCASGTAFNTTNWGASTTGTQVTLPFNVTGCTFIQTNAGTKVSICYSTSSGANVYTITGEGGTAATQPQLQVTYTCTGVSGVSATATPTPICTGSTLTLTGTATGATSYAWTGPGSFSAATLSTSTTAAATSAGIYTLTAYNTAGCGTAASTVSVVVNTSPVAINPSAATVLCIPGSTTFTDGTPSGTWISSSPGIASVGASSGTVTGVGQGTATITYKLTSSGCYVTKPVTVNAVPGAITGPGVVCGIGSTITLGNTAITGTWSASPSSVATIDATGVLTGVAYGTVLVSYSNNCGSASRIISVNPIPEDITGPSTVCEGGATITLSDATAGGTWSSSPTTKATASTLSATQGVITGVGAGTATVVYTSPLNCTASMIVTINPLPGAITGTLHECRGATTVLSNPIAGGTWSSSAATTASVGSSTGIVTGVSVGIAVITYTNGCGYRVAIDTVLSAPSPITGRDSLCMGGTTALADDILGGTWSTSASTIATVLPGSGLVSAVAVGKCAIIYTLSTGCYTLDSVRVFPLPPAITGVRKVCEGATTNLFNASPGGGTWSSAMPSVASVGSTSGVVSGMNTDTTTIVFTSAVGCKTSVIVTVNPRPLPITATTDRLCAKLGDTLYDATPGGVWSSATPSIATIDAATGVVVTLTGGNAIFSYTLPATGCARTKTIQVDALPNPPVYYDNWAVSMSTDPIYTSYQWYNSVDGLIPGAVIYKTAATTTANYYVVVVDGIGCEGKSANKAFNENAVGVTNLQEGKVLIYPNPASNTISVASAVNAHVTIATLDGRNVAEGKATKAIDISSLAAGAYIVSVYDEQGNVVASDKLLKK